MTVQPEPRTHPSVDHATWLQVAAPETAPEPTRRTIEQSRALIATTLVRPRSTLSATIVRTLDILVAVGLLIITLPIIVALVIVIRCDSAGPAIFRQTRVGHRGVLFRFYKFRTMYVDARERHPGLYAYDYTSDEIETMYFKLPDDPRCTRVGKWLRRTSLDELPNLVNIIRGDMAIVGPRPEIPEMLPHYGVSQLAKFAVKPGLTGPSQIGGRNLLTFQQTIAYDLDYVSTRTVFGDISIIARTPLAVMRMIGAL
jgi:lipopolysaccharide/colanic/teichoic acid biosynthesis glycosyltransferase